MRRGRVGLAAAALLVVAPVSRAQDPTRVVIDRARIESAGWFNLGEMLTGATGWQRTTLDAVGFLVGADWLQPGAVAPGEPEWLVLVDGQRVVVGLLGARLLELLPISPSQVESVTVTRVPRLVAGTVAGRGVVEFHTRRAPRGVAGAGAWHSGNVTGDPGPYAFTPAPTDNVDRLGPYNHAHVSLAGPGWSVAAGANQGSSHITHRGMRERFDPVLYQQLGEEKWAPYDAVNARVGATLLGGRHDLVAGRGWVDGPVFLPLAGGEQWMRASVAHLGGAGSVTRGATALRYELTHSGLDVGELPSPFPFVAGHSRARTAAAVDIGVTEARGGTARIGGSTARWEMERDGATVHRTDANLFVDVSLPGGAAAYGMSGALARSSGGPIAAKGVVTTRIAVDSATSLTAALGFVQHAIGDDGTWIDRALLGLDTLGRERDARAWLDVGAVRRVGGTWLAELGARTGTVGGIQLLASDGQPAGGPLAGAAVEVRAGVSAPPTPRLPVARLAYRYFTVMRAVGALRAALGATPAHALEGQVAVSPAPDLRLGVLLYATSRAHWAALRGGPPSPVSLATLSRLDLSAEKWLWRRRIRTQLVLRNALDRPERYHPLGAELPLRAHLTVALRLPPLS